MLSGQGNDAWDTTGTWAPVPAMPVAKCIGPDKPWLLGRTTGATVRLPSGQKSCVSVVLVSKLFGIELVAARLSWHMPWALSCANCPIECIWLGGNGPEDTGLGSTCTGSSAAGAKCNSGASSWLLPGIVIEAGGYNMASTRISWWLNTTVRQIWIHTFLCVFYFWLAMQTEDY